MQIDDMPPENMQGREVPIGIAGAGRIAQALGRLLRERGQPVVAIASRGPDRARAAAEFIGGGVAAASYSELPARAGRLLIAVPDEALESVAATLAGAGIRSGVALHTCGARGPEALAPLAAQGVSCGTLHPLQTVPAPMEGVQRLPGVAFAVGGDPAAVRWAEQIATLLDGQILRIAPGDRPIYHAAAVMASNYITGLVDAAIVLLGAAGVDEASARRALGPLVRASAESAIAQGPLEALTGPIERGDAGTIAAHLEALAGYPEPLRQLYRAGGLQILEIARRRGLPAAAASKLEELLLRKWRVASDE